MLDWSLSQPGFDPSYGNLVCLATLMSSDRTKQICLWMTIYIYIYIYIYVNFVKHNRHFLSILSLYNIRWELIDVFCIIVHIPSTFRPTLGHHQGKVYYKSVVTVVCTLLFVRRRASGLLQCAAFAFKIGL